MNEELNLKVLNIRNCARQFLESEEVKTKEGNTIKFDEIDGLLITHKGYVFVEWHEDDNTIHNLPYETLAFPKKECEKGCPASPLPKSGSKEGDISIQERIENIIDFYLEGEGEELGKKGLASAIVSLITNLMCWYKTFIKNNQ